jgi:acyl-coenzyme A thioesterase PaaI-like protein
MGVTQVGAGSATVMMPASPWMGQADGTIHVNMLIQNALIMATVTSLPAASDAVPATFSVHHLRPCTMEGRAFVARARVVNTGPHRR